MWNNADAENRKKNPGILQRYMKVSYFNIWKDLFAIICDKAVK